MEVMQKGQLSYMILSCLSERDMYGLELIEEIEARYGYTVKMPSLYSNLNRMKELKYIYSYLKDSVKGPKCSYSSITELGREELVRLQAEFDGIQAKKQEQESLSNVFERVIASVSPEPEKVDEPDEPEKDDDLDEFFSFTSDDEASPLTEIESVQNEETSSLTEEETSVSEIENEQDEETSETSSLTELENVQTEETTSLTEIENTQTELSQNAQSEAEFTQINEIAEQNETKSPQEYNQRVYDAAKDFSRNRNKRSYAENQIELALSSQNLKADEERTQQNINELKTALLNSRQGHYEPIHFEERKPVEQESEVKEDQTAQVSEPKADDGRYITERYEIPKPKRIEPAKLNVTIPTFDKSLPAPKRNIAVDPTMSDVKAKLESLYAKGDVKKQPKTVEAGEFENYDDLRRYYKSQEVDFKVYERPLKRPKHNTNLLKLYVSLFIFGLIGVGNAFMYLIFSLTKMTSPSTNFVYYLFPIIALVYVVYCFYNYKTMVSRVPNKLWHPAVVWTIFALSIVAIFLINYACGMQFTSASTYFSTILVPIFASACGTVGLYYATMVAYKKYWA